MSHYSPWWCKVSFQAVVSACGGKNAVRDSSRFIVFDFVCQQHCTFRSLWAMSVRWRYSMAVPMSCMISDASDEQDTDFDVTGTQQNSISVRVLIIMADLSPWRPGLLWPECDWTAPLPPYWNEMNQKEIRARAATYRGPLAHNQSLLLTTTVLVPHYLQFVWNCIIGLNDFGLKSQIQKTIIFLNWKQNIETWELIMTSSDTFYTGLADSNAIQAIKPKWV